MASGVEAIAPIAAVPTFPASSTTPKSDPSSKTAHVLWRDAIFSSNGNTRAPVLPNSLTLRFSYLVFNTPLMDSISHVVLVSAASQMPLFDAKRVVAFVKHLLTGKCFANNTRNAEMLTGVQNHRIRTRPSGTSSP